MQLVLLHGMGQTAASWQNTILNLPNDWHIHMSTLLGNDELVTYEQLYQSFVVECEKYTEPFHICGLSLGAVLACRYAIEYPNKVKSLLLIAVQLKPSRYLLKFQQLIFSLLPKSYFRKHGLHKEQLLLLSSSMQKLNLKAGVQQLQCPILLVCGEKDYFNQQAAKDFVRTVEHAQYVVIKQAGHEVNMEKPVELAGVIEHFLIGGK